MSIIAHEEIKARLYVGDELVGDDWSGLPMTSVEIQHDLCCPREITIGCLSKGHRMYMTTMYLSRDAALSVAFALRAAVMHIDHPDMFTDDDLDDEAQWRDAHAKALEWVMKQYGKERW
jgi:hypothetical protein